MITQGRAELGGTTEDQPIEVGVIPKWIQVVIVLGTNTQVGLQIESALQRLQREVNRTQTRAGSSKTVVDMRGFGFAFESAFKHLLRRDVLAAV